MYSFHYFMFPFRFDKIVSSFKDRHDFYKKFTFDERVTKAIAEELKPSLEKNGWKYQKFQIEDELDYNEIAYFYDFVKDSLFNTTEFKKNATSYFFEKDINKDAKYIVNLKNTSYELDLTGITLRVFDTGIGILSFEVENHKYNKIEDILKINDFSRRIYHQFVAAKESNILAQSISIDGIEDKFNLDYKKGIKIPSFILNILGENFTINSTAKDKFFIQPILDDRMYVISWYGDEKFSNTIKDNFIDNDTWYKYVFIDSENKTIQDENMQEELIKKSTYTRWKGYGTLYGITRYSFVCVTNRDDFSKNIILNHIKTLYFQMIILLLAQRASSIRFSDEVTAISDIDTNKEDKISEKISNLYKNYLRFKNKLYFKEITPQEQGIELYDKARDIMRIDIDINDLSNEIASLNSYAFFLDEKEEKEQMNALTKLGTIFLPGTFIAGILGMNVFPANSIDNIGSTIFAFIAIISLTIWLTTKNNIDIYKFLKTGKL